MSKNIELETKLLQLVEENTSIFPKDAKLEISEVGDGNVNYIYRVNDEDHSVIVKFANSFIRDSDTRELSTKRNEIEYEILTRQNQLSPGSVPVVYHYSSDMNCIIMEDLSSFDVLREGLKEYKTYPHLAKKLSRFLYDVLFKTTDLVMDEEEKKNLAGHLVNVDMCEISERLVFTEPYLNNQKLNRYHASNEDFVTKELYKNDKLKLEVAKLKNQFMNNTESMIHGDLHSGSIFISHDDFKVFDPEFSFYGPMGYDIGNVIASLTISYVVSKYENKSEHENYQEWLLDSIKEMIDEFIVIYHNEYEKDVTTYMFNNSDFKDYYLEKIMSDTAGYAGTEMIRRTVGVAKVWDLDRVQDHEKIAEIERSILSIGKDLILNRDKIQVGNDFTSIINESVQV
ncbi:S-methyl-5-thioribose kinase [Erysipelothrix urinaevulpis]|uniref:S-methyl-5-thioribose kinase n=1 Tax=Erysipelothrix urinaevulpis TaxID=2683717 RepID=UPI001356DCD5|nr:S-methyl-5-thioribose kinase [Erysipelothrix urinaevulpis]